MKTLSELTVREMWKQYNEHAKKLGRPQMRPMIKDRVRMAAALAILLTYRPKTAMAAKPLRKGVIAEVREVAIEELCRVHYYEHLGARIEPKKAGRFSKLTLVAFGFPYRAVLETIQARLPLSKIDEGKLRIYATEINQGLHGDFELPKRPRPLVKRGRRNGQRSSDAANAGLRKEPSTKRFAYHRGRNNQKRSRTGSANGNPNDGASVGVSPNSGKA